MLTNHVGSIPSFLIFLHLLKFYQREKKKTKNHIKYMILLYILHRGSNKNKRKQKINKQNLLAKA